MDERLKEVRALLPGSQEPLGRALLHHAQLVVLRVHVRIREDLFHAVGLERRRSQVLLDPVPEHLRGDLPPTGRGRQKRRI